ncbi:ABC transporter substrate-binding protein [Mesorhizobium hawassense]|uniref:ABC transporter substrate-binding protein n=1 Tax=Mesorhizobium hawassense TaxID=1209954 RepID=A0A330HJY5_9HYPH|nr:ABC transporter substrate-binding protein [Mesorhizobium hawassense]RAZ89006.1 ABC transporter substrate-binding protein [Mesorhizobium hawassense]
MPKARDHAHLVTLKTDLANGQISRRAFLRTATLLGMSAAAAYAFAGGEAATANAAEAKPKGGTLRISTTVYDVKSPAIAATTAHPLVYSQVVEYLAKTGTDNVTRPHLLSSWEPSADLKTWTLHIRDGVKWHSGRPFVADDVIWNLKRLLSDEVGSSMLGLMEAYMLKPIDTGKTDEKGNKIIKHQVWTETAIEKVDDKTIRLNLQAPQLAVPEHLAHFPAVMLYPEENGVFGPGSVGTGAFTLKEINVSRNAVLEAVSDYWGEGPYLDKLEFVDLGGSEQANVNALMSGQVDGAFQVLPEFFPVLRKQENLTYYEVTTADTSVVRMNLKHKPFDDSRVRLAFRLAVDVTKAEDVTFGQFAVPAEHTHVSPIHPEYAKLPPFERDLERAKALLAEAGYPNGVDVELIIPQNPPHHLRNATALTEMWKEAGIRAAIKVVPNLQYWDVWTTAPLGMTVWAHRPLGVMNLSLAYRSNAAWNESAFANAEFDALLDKAESIPDPKARSVVMADIEALMQREGPIVQTYWRNLITFYDKKVLGFAMHPTYMLSANELAIQAA